MKKCFVDVCININQLINKLINFRMRRCCTVATFGISLVTRSKLSNNDSKTDSDSQNPCNQFNSAYKKLFGRENINSCNKHKNCVYIGDVVSGKCEFVPIDITKAHSHVDDETTSANPSSEAPSGKDNEFHQTLKTVAKGKRKIYAEIIGVDDISRGLRPVKVLVNESFVASALDSIKAALNSHDLANSLAKDLVINILDASDNRPKLGKWLQYIFDYESVRNPTRWLVYWSIARTDTIHQSSSLLRTQIDYWCVKEGFPTTKSLLLGLTNNWLVSKESQRDAIVPLIKWVVQDQYVNDVLRQGLEDVLPSTKVFCLLNLIC